MGVWKNLMTAVRGHATNAAEAVQDKNILVILDQQVRDAKTALGKAKEERAKMVAKASVKQKAIEKLNAEVTRLTEGARQAKAQDKIELAREAMTKVVSLKGQIESEQELKAQFEQSATQMSAKIKQTEARLDGMKRQIESAKANEALIAAQKAASTNSSASNSKLAGAMDSLERLEQRQAEQSALLDAYEQEDSGSNLEEKLASLDGGSKEDIDALLKDL